MDGKNIDEESMAEAVEAMRLELEALEGMLDLIEIAAGCEALDLNLPVCRAAYGARLMVQRQRHRLERHFLPRSAASPEC